MLNNTVNRVKQIKKNIGVYGSDVRYNIYSTNDQKQYEIVKVQKKVEIESQLLTIDEAYQDHVPYYVRNAIRGHYLVRGIEEVSE